MRISVTRFGGIEPKTDPTKLGYDPESGYCKAQTAQDCDLSSGSLKPYYNESKDSDASLSTTILTLYRYASSYWLEFSADVDIVPGPIAADTQNKLYYTGDGIPKKTNETEATTGSGAMPITYFPMAVPTPTAALSSALGSGGSGDTRAIAYKWTIVTSWGEEGYPSAASTIINAMEGQTVNLSGMTLEWQASTDYVKANFVIPSTGEAGYVYKCTTAGQGASTEPTWPTTPGETVSDGGCIWTCFDSGILYDSGKKRIYRSNTGASDTSYQYLTEIDITVETYADSTTDTGLGEVLPTSDWNPPDDGLDGLVSLGNFLAAFKGKDVYFSEPNYPYAYPSKYSYSVPDNIVALGAIDSTLIVMTDQGSYVSTGGHPDAHSPVKVPQRNKCLAKRGVVETQWGVLFPAPFGLCLNDGAKEIVLTRNLYTRNQWEDLYPATFHAVFHEGRYVAFYSYGSTEGGISIPLEEGELTTLSFYADAAYVDPASGKLYYVKSTDQVLLMIGGTPYPSRDSIIQLIGGDNLLMV